MIRNPDTIIGGELLGAWFIYALSKVINEEKYGKEVEIHNVLIKVNKEVSHFYDQRCFDFTINGERIKQIHASQKHMCQMPEFRSTMREELHLSKSYSGHGTFYRKMMMYLEKIDRQRYEDVLVLEQKISQMSRYFELE